MSTDQGTYNFFIDFMHKHAGVKLDSEKQYLIDARLNPLIKKNCIETLEELVEVLQSNDSHTITHAVIDALTTHETYFFRDTSVFELINSTIIPRLSSCCSDTKEISIWSAACSTGQELYSVGMLLAEHTHDFSNWNIQLTGSDISKDVLKKASCGEYTDYEISRGLSEEMKTKYFKKKEVHWKVTLPDYMHVDFHEKNLNELTPEKEKYDLILIRNVLIYFEIESRKTILKHMHRALKPHGIMLLGTAETTINIVDCFNSHSEQGSTYYTKKTYR